MKRHAVIVSVFILLSIGTLTGMLEPVLGAEEKLYYFSVSLVQPRTRQLIPIKVYYNDHLTLDRKMHIPHGSTFFVRLLAPMGRYVSVVFRDEGDTLYDLPMNARYLDTGTKQFTWTMPRRFMPGRVEFGICLWTLLIPGTDTLDGAFERTGFLNLGDTAI